MSREYYVNRNSWPVVCYTPKGVKRLFVKDEGTFDCHYRRFVQAGKLSREYRDESGAVAAEPVVKRPAARNKPGTRRAHGRREEARVVSRSVGSENKVGTFRYSLCAPQVGEAAAAANVQLVVVALSPSQAEGVVHSALAAGILESHVVVWMDGGAPGSGIAGEIGSWHRWGPGAAWMIAAESQCPWVLVAGAGAGVTAEQVGVLIHQAQRGRMVGLVGKRMDWPGWVYGRSTDVLGWEVKSAQEVDVLDVRAGTIVDRDLVRRSLGRYSALGRAWDRALDHGVAMSAATVMEQARAPLVVPCPGRVNLPQEYSGVNRNGLASTLLLSAASAGWKPRSREVDIPPVCYLTPTYGRATVLGEMLACIDAQEYPDVHCLVVNDGPRPLQADCQKVKIVNAKERFASLGWKRRAALTMGMEWYKNELGKGTRWAQMPVVFHGDDDDKYLPWHTAQVVAQLLSNPNYWCARPRYGWVFAGREGRLRLYSKHSWPFEGQMGFLANKALELKGYGLQDSGQAKVLLDAFIAHKRIAFFRPWPTESYIYRRAWGGEQVSQVKVPVKCEDFGTGKLVLPPAQEIYNRYWPMMNAMLAEEGWPWDFNVRGKQR